MSGFTIDFVEVEVPCPRCGFFNPIWLRQARLRDVIICRGCKANVQLEDHMNEVRKAETAVRQAVNDLARSFKSISRKLTIRL
jgi:hypothetical protein